MKIIKQSWEWLREPNGEDILRIIEIAGRTCYKSEDKITDTSHYEFVKRMLNSGHHAMIEHGQIPPVRVITDRGVTHEIVRHRLFSFAQESTRYCNYSQDKFNNELTFIEPVFWSDDISNKERWTVALLMCEDQYLNMLQHNATPQEARSVLPNSLKTEIIITGNVREWRHFFILRCSPKAHPQMQDIALLMLKGFKEAIPVLYDDIYEMYFKK